MTSIYSFYQKTSYQRMKYRIWKSLVMLKYWHNVHFWMCHKSWARCTQMSHPNFWCHNVLRFWLVIRENCASRKSWKRQWILLRLSYTHVGRYHCIEICCYSFIWLPSLSVLGRTNYRLLKINILHHSF